MNHIRVFTAAALATLALTNAASAALPPQVYERARNEAANVVTIEVTGVETTGDRACAVQGTVSTVERGDRFSVGEDIRLAVPCTGHVQVTPMTGAVIYQRTSALQESRWARAYLDGNGALVLSQYEILAADPKAPAAE